MKKENIKLQRMYTAKIGSKLTIVEILAKHHHGGWKAKDVFTEKTLRIKSGRTLQCPC
ncbi:MAG TPA: hypothetical protein P5175_06335 [Anaerohalosphaeraceae bacterium]|nr:hypothetical protein [Anaerohalosphaeraceae bacterium]HRS71453.1 hypothetical protein [Anaerohalosphaeraceae bacterium]